MTDVERMQELLDTKVGDLLGPRTHPTMLYARLEMDVLAVVAAGEISHQLLRGLHAMGLMVEASETGPTHADKLETQDLGDHYKQMFKKLEKDIACPSCADVCTLKEWIAANPSTATLLELVGIFNEIGSNKKLTPYLTRVVPQIVAQVMTQSPESKDIMVRLMDTLQKLVVQARPEDFQDA